MEGKGTLREFLMATMGRHYPQERVEAFLDGYPLARKGEAGEAIGLLTVMSFVGGMIGVTVLVIAALARAPRKVWSPPRQLTKRPLVVSTFRC